MVAWQRLGVWERLHALLLADMRAAARRRDRSPVAWTVTGGNRNDVTLLIPLVERVPPVRGKFWSPRRRPDRVTHDRGYDHDKCGRELHRRGVASEIARRQTGHGSGFGRVRWVVERTFARLRHFKRLLVRYDRHHEIHAALLAIGCCLICFRRLQSSCDSSSTQCKSS